MDRRQVPRMYDVCAELLNSMKSMYIVSLACISLKGREIVTLN